MKYNYNPMWKIIFIKPNKCMNPLIKADKSINNIRNLNKCVMSPLPLARVCVALWRVHVAAPVWMMAVMFRRERLCCFPLSSMSLVIFPRHQCGINVWAGWLGSGRSCSPPFGPLPFLSTTHVTPPAPSSASCLFIPGCIIPTWRSL